MHTVTIILPSGYESPEAFAKDCGFELAEDKANALILRNNALLTVLGDCFDYFNQYSPTSQPETQILSRIKELGL